MLQTLDKEKLLQDYGDEGYAIVESVLDPDLIAEASGHIEWLRKKHPDVRPEAFTHSYILDDPFWIRLATDPRLAEVVEPFLGPDIALWGAHYISKAPRDGLAVKWHQDGSYWPLEPMKVMTLWLAVDDSTPENGCMRVIPRSHAAQIMRPHLRRETAGTALQIEIEPAYVDLDQAADVVIPAGGVSIHDPYMIHGSEANLSDKRRCGLTLRYIPTDVKVLREKHPVYLCRGEAREDINWYPPLPKFRAADHYPFRGSDEAPWV